MQSKNRRRGNRHRIERIPLQIARPRAFPRLLPFAIEEDNDEREEKCTLLVAAEPDMTGRGLEPARHSDGARILYLVGCIAAIYGAYLSAQWAVTTADIPIDLTAGSGVGEVLFLVIILVCCYLFTGYVWGQSVSGFFLAYVRAWRKTLRGFAACAGLTFVIALAWFAFIFAIGGAQWSSAAWAEVDWNTLRVVLRRSLVAIVLASTEELVFRGIAFKYLIGAGGRVAVVRAIVVSSVIFSLSHHFQDPEYWLDVGAIGLFIGLFLIGVLLCLVYYVTNSLACAIGVHSGLIWFAVLKKTEVLQLIPSGWTVSNAFDPRAQPATWLLFILLSVVIFGLRHRLHGAFAVESLDPSAPWATRSLAAPRRERAFVFGGVVACIVAAPRRAGADRLVAATGALSPSIRRPSPLSRRQQPPTPISRPPRAAPNSSPRPISVWA